jgi:hypothetical protein
VTDISNGFPNNVVSRDRKGKQEKNNLRGFRQRHCVRYNLNDYEQNDADYNARKIFLLFFSEFHILSPFFISQK